MKFLRYRCISWAFSRIFAVLLCLQLLACTTVQASNAISIEALATQIQQDRAPLILDVRSPQEYAEGHIPGAVNIDYREVQAQIDTQIDSLQAYENSEVIVYCERGVRASKAEATLTAAGFSAVRHLEGDMSAWREADLPIEEN